MSNAPRDRRGKRYWGDDDSQTNILHIDMDSFFAQVEIREDPSLLGKAVIVGGSSNRGVVTSATYEARALGVRAGMPTARARALCPTAVFVPGHFELYREYSKRVMSVIGRFSPLVEQVSVDEAFVDVRGSRLRFGKPMHIAGEIRRQIREEIGLPASVGIASTKSVAKIASTNQNQSLKRDKQSPLFPQRDRSKLLLQCPHRERSNWEWHWLLVALGHGSW